MSERRGMQAEMESTGARAREPEAAPQVEVGLVERAAAGDAAAFGELYAAHLDAVYRHLCFCLHDPEAAADLTQEVFLKAYRRLDSLRRPERFRAWLFRIAHNQLLNQRRRRTEPALDDGLLEARPDGSPPPEALAERQLDLERTLAAAAELTDLQRQVIALRFISGLGVAETAAIMNRTPNAIHNLQHNALAALRRRLGQMEPER